MLNLIENFKEKARKLNKTIVLPEGEEPRVIRAAEKITAEGFAKIIILGDEKVIREKCPDAKLDGVKIVNPKTSEKVGEYAKVLFELRKAKGMTEEEAERLIKDEMYYGVMMVKMGEADGMVGGAVHSTGDMLRPALQIVKTAPGINTVSGFFIMNHPQKTEKSCFLFADCAVTPEPTSEQLVDIAVCSEKSARVFLAEEPKIALLSFSTKGSAKHPLVEKVQEAARMIKEKYPELPIDGELTDFLDKRGVRLQLSVYGQLEAKGSKVAGHANVFIFPDLNAGNISYKLVQRLGGFDAYGPICQGFAKPINDLSRGCNVDDIVGTVALTAIEASIN